MSRMTFKLSGPPELLSRCPLHAPPQPPLAPPPPAASAKKPKPFARRRAISGGAGGTQQLLPLSPSEAAFAEAWGWYEAQAVTVLAKANAEIHAALREFLAERHRAWLDRDGNGGGGCSRLPFAVLLTGVNTPDRDTMLSDLADMLARDAGCRVAQVGTDDLVGSGRLFSRALAQWMPELAESAVPATVRHSFMRAADVYSRGVPGAPQRPQQLVLLIRDFDEATGGRALGRFVQVSSNYSSVLPIAFVCGLSKTPSSLQALLGSGGGLSRLFVRRFQSVPPQVLIGQVIDRVLINCRRFPHRLSRATYGWMMDTFDSSDNSVAGFMTRLKLALLEHFCSGAAASAAASSELHLPGLRAVPLVMRALKFLLGWHNSCELYLLTLSPGHLCDSPEYKEHLARLLQSNTKAVLEVVIACQLDLESRQPLPEGEEDGEEFECLARMRDAWLNDLAELMKHLRLRIEETAAAAAAADGSCDPPNPLTRQHHHQQLRANIDRLAELRGLGADLRARVAACLERRLRADLPEPEPGSHANCRQLLASAFSADVRGSVERQLQAGNNETDLGAVWRLHRECGRHLNMRDLMRAFACQRRLPGEGEGKGEDEDDEAEDARLLTQELQTRCLLACAELELLGCVRSTNQKPDYMVRDSAA